MVEYSEENAVSFAAWLATEPITHVVHLWAKVEKARMSAFTDARAFLVSSGEDNAKIAEVYRLKCDELRLIWEELNRRHNSAISYMLHELFNRA